MAWSRDADHEGQDCDMSVLLCHIFEVKRASNRQSRLIFQAEVSL